MAKIFFFEDRRRLSAKQKNRRTLATVQSLWAGDVTTTPWSAERSAERFQSQWVTCSAASALTSTSLIQWEVPEYPLSHAEGGTTADAASTVWQLLQPFFKLRLTFRSAVTCVRTHLHTLTHTRGFPLPLNPNHASNTRPTSSRPHLTLTASEPKNSAKRNGPTFILLTPAR